MLIDVTEGVVDIIVRDHKDSEECFDKSMADFLQRAMLVLEEDDRFSVIQCQNGCGYFLDYFDGCPECGFSPEDEIEIGDTVILPDPEGEGWQEYVHARVTGFETIDGKSYAIVIDFSGKSWCIPKCNLVKE